MRYLDDEYLTIKPYIFFSQSRVNGIYDPPATTPGCGPKRLQRTNAGIILCNQSGRRGRRTVITAEGSLHSRQTLT